MQLTFDPQSITAILAIMLSILFQAVPGASAWWATFKYKHAAWLIGCFVVPAVWVGLAYAGAPVGVVLPGPFVWDGLFLILRTGALAYAAGQAAYAIPKAKRDDDISKMNIEFAKAWVKTVSNSMAATLLDEEDER